ncbi:MAG: class I SAM-dependent methyltransferase [Marinosulfonomonas sp.]
MTPLTDVLIRNIASSGPMTIAEFMATCMLHPDHGYYSTRDPFGAKGDFTTAPEISQMFGELIGLWVAQCWMDQGRPDPFVLAEAGPGRGTLMADILRVGAKVPGFREAAQIVLVEASPHLRAVQQETLHSANAEWIDTVSDLPQGPLFLVANEFFDALPIRQFTRHASGWQEHNIGVQQGKLTLGLSGAAPVGVLDHRLDDTTPGDILEICSPAQTIIQDIAARIAKDGGVALVVDYGDWDSLGDTLQALKSHEVDDILAHPGQADLTAHVDFKALADAASDVSVTDMVPQGVLLERLGITPRAQALAQNMDEAALSSHIAAHRRLTHPDEMGTLFKAIAFHPKTTPTPPGFAP